MRLLQTVRESSGEPSVVIVQLWMPLQPLHNRVRVALHTGDERALGVSTSLRAEDCVDCLTEEDRQVKRGDRDHIHHNLREPERYLVQSAKHSQVGSTVTGELR